MEYFRRIPEEIVREILMRVSYKSYSRLKKVCKSWKALLESPKFYEDRMRSGMSEEFICLLQTVNNKCDQFNQGPLVSIYDPINNLWETLPPIPTEFEFYSYSKCIYVKQKLVLLGLSERYRAGSKRKRLKTTKTILVYDFLSCKWRKRADMPTPNFLLDFACCASPQGLIYIAGGRQNFEITRQAAVYNVEADEWKLLPNLLQKQCSCDCVFMEGVLYVLSLHDEEIQRFEPEKQVWSTLSNMWFIEDCVQPMVAAFGRLYCFHWDVVTEFDSTESYWRIVDDLPQTLDSVAAAVLGDGIFLSGLESGTHNIVFYIYQPPLNTGVLRERWISVHRPQHISHGWIESLATMII